MLSPAEHPQGHRGSGATLPLLEGTFGTVHLLFLSSTSSPMGSHRTGGWFWAPQQLQEAEAAASPTPGQGAAAGWVTRFAALPRSGAASAG